MEIPSTSHSLLSRLSENESQRAWAEFDKKYRVVIHNWCLRRGLGSDAEDVTQEVLLKLSRALPGRIHDPTRALFRSWLKTVVENAVHDHWRKRVPGGEPLPVGGSSFLEYLGNFADLGGGRADASSLSKAVESKAAAAIRRTRERVNEKTWVAFLRASFEKRPAAEVAQELELTATAVFKNAYRVKQILREELSRPEENA